MQPITSLVAVCPSENAADLQVVRIDVEEGQKVAAGQILMLIEFHKVVVEITAPCNGIVEKIHRSLWDEVQVGERLIDLRSADDVPLTSARA